MTTETEGDTRVLIIDDDEALLRMIRLCLAADGFRVATARDGLLGLDKLEAEPFDAVVLDLQMPQMDGRSLFREMRARGYDIPVVILSAYRAEDARRELSADAAIDKPFDPDVLTHTVRRLTSQQSSEQPA